MFITCELICETGAQTFKIISVKAVAWISCCCIVVLWFWIFLKVKIRNSALNGFINASQQN